MSKGANYDPTEDELLRWKKSVMACDIAYDADKDTKFDENKIKNEWDNTFQEEITEITFLYGGDVYSNDHNVTNDVRGVIIRTNNKTVVAIRGTNSSDDAICDMNGFKTHKGDELLKKINIHQGFYDVFEKLDKDAIYNSIKSDMENGKEIEWTGHSMGGAVVELLALYCHERYNAEVLAEQQKYNDELSLGNSPTKPTDALRGKETVVVFGGANYTDADGVNKVNEICDVTHIVHGNDPIAWLSIIFGFSETGFRVNMPDSDPFRSLADWFGSKISSIGDFIDHDTKDYRKALEEGKFRTGNPNKGLLDSYVDKYHCNFNLQGFFPPALHQPKPNQPKGPAP